jgi:CBS domain containing-hemolysin-like protein
MDLVIDIFYRYGLLLVAAAAIGVAALFNGMETGVYRVNRIRLRLRADAGHRGAMMLSRLLGDLRGTLCACLVGYDSSIYLTTAIVTTLVARAGWAAGDFGTEILATALLAPIFFVFTDVTPKGIFAVHADRWMYRLAGLLNGAYWLFTAIGLVPVLKGLSGVVLRVARGRKAIRGDPFDARQRMLAFLREGAAEGVISGYQEELIDKVLALRQTPVRQVMIPIGRAASVPVDIDRARFIEQVRQHSYSRLPVWGKRTDDIVGVVRVDAVLAAEGEAFDLRRLMRRDFPTVSPDTPVSQAMIRMQRRRAAMAVVQSDRGRAIGILTIKDLVEEIVGELEVW